MQNVAFILPFVLLIPMWVGISHLLARISGWHRLATVYRASESAGGKSCGLCSGSFGVVSYRNCLLVTLHPSGLHICVLFFFRLAHPPLFIPWSDITISPTKFLWWGGVRLHFAQCPRVFFSTAGPLAKQLTEAKREHTSRTAVVA